MAIGMISQLIPHVQAASQRSDCRDSCVTLVNTFGVYWTKRQELFTPATRCAIVRCMTDFLQV